MSFVFSNLFQQYLLAIKIILTLQNALPLNDTKDLIRRKSKYFNQIIFFFEFFDQFAVPLLPVPNAVLFCHIWRYVFVYNPHRIRSELFIFNSRHGIHTFIAEFINPLPAMSPNLGIC